MTINTTLKILMCSSALVFAGISTASAHQHETGEAAAAHMKDKAKDAAMDHAMDKAEGAMMDKAEGAMMDKGAATMKEKATDMAMDKAKGMAKDKVLGTAGGGVAGKAEHMMKEKAMDHAMDKAEGAMMDHAKGKAEHSMKEGKVMSGSEHAMQEKMSAPAAVPAAQPVKLLSFDEALAVCRANPTGGLQECIDERTGQGAMRKQLNGS